MNNVQCFLINVRLIQVLPKHGIFSVNIKIFAYVFALPSTNVSPSLKTYKKRVLRFECIKRDCIYIMTHGSCTT